MDDKPVSALRKKARFFHRPRRGTGQRRQGRRPSFTRQHRRPVRGGDVQGRQASPAWIAVASPRIPRQGNEFVLLDAGANIECKPLHLAQFAVMGSVYSREVLGRKNPRVGILSIGTEDSKGNELTLEAFKLCSGWI
jgi:hypothetical protein